MENRTAGMLVICSVCLIATGTGMHFARAPQTTIVDAPRPTAPEDVWKSVAALDCPCVDQHGETFNFEQLRGKHVFVSAILPRCSPLEASILSEFAWSSLRCGDQANVVAVTLVWNSCGDQAPHEFADFYSTFDLWQNWSFLQGEEQFANSVINIIRDDPSDQEPAHRGVIYIGPDGSRSYDFWLMSPSGRERFHKLLSRI